MKPNWKHAPEWAQYMAKDGDHRWYWYSEEPTWDRLLHIWISSGRFAQAHKVKNHGGKPYTPGHPFDSLERRPK